MQAKPEKPARYESGRHESPKQIAKLCNAELGEYFLMAHKGRLIEICIPERGE